MDDAHEMFRPVYKLVQGLKESNLQTKFFERLNKKGDAWLKLDKQYSDLEDILKANQKLTDAQITVLKSIPQRVKDLKIKELVASITAEIAQAKTAKKK